MNISDFIADKTNPLDLKKLIDELNSQSYEEFNLLIKIDTDNITEFNFTKTIK